MNHRQTTYKITTEAGQDCGTFEADSPGAALDLHAQAAGYQDWMDLCERLEQDPDYWTSSRSAMLAGDFGLYVEPNPEATTTG